MDDQHGILMDTMNELRQAVVRGTGMEAVSGVLQRLIEFTRMHFWSEEQLMEQTGYPELAKHRAEHQRLFAQLMESVHRVQQGETVPMQPMLCRMRDVYIEHIEDEDRQYGPWLNARGVD